LNYQYTTDTSLELLRAHAVSYQIPLPWRHTISMYGSYVQGKADFPESMSDFKQEITSWQASFRYEIPLIPMGQFRHQLSWGFDYKRSNNGLEFGSEAVSESATEIDQFMGGYNCALTDPIGHTRFGLEVYYSPGNLTAGNNDEIFELLRFGAPDVYGFGRATLERITKLPWGFSWVLNGSVQYADERLLPSEELGLGGWQTVRGYDERVINGDKGWFASTELRTPPISLVSPLVRWVSGANKKNGFRMNDQFQALVFFDVGYTRLNNVQEGELESQRLASWGVGCRYTINPYLAFRFDYGFQMHDSGASKVTPDLEFTEGSMGHIGVIASF